MRRIYFLVPDIATTKKIVDDLLLTRIEEKHIHVIAKRGTPLEDLPEANLLQKSDFIPAVGQGLALGGSTGMLAGLVAVVLPPASTVIAGGILLATTLAGAGVGARTSRRASQMTGGVQHTRGHARQRKRVRVRGPSSSQVAATISIYIVIDAWLRGRSR